jgi:hypothetical protein
LELEDDFTAKLARAAAAAEAFQRSMGKTRTESDRTSASLSKADRDTQKFSATVTRSTRELDSYSGRLGLVASAIGALGPAAVPITAVAIPAVAGLAQSFGFAAAAGGTAILAFQGVGDALTALSKAQLDPTTANLAKAKEALERLSPAAQDLVLKIRSMSGELKKLRDAAGEGILPGASEALDELENRLPIVERILRQVSLGAGEALADAGQSLAGPEWDKFFNFIAREARPELEKFAKTVGNLAHGFAELWVAFGPLNSSFSSFLLQSARSFDDWATGLSKTQGFHDFVAYIREAGPQVGAALAAIGNALVQIVEAAAPIGGPVLQSLTAVASAIATIADSPLGTPIFGAIAAFSALNLVMKAWGGIASLESSKFVGGQIAAAKAIGTTTREMVNLNAVTAKNATATAGLLAGNQRIGSSLKTLAGGAAVMGGLALASTGAADKVGLTHTQWLALGGAMLGPLGAAVGAGAGLLWDVADSGDAAADSLAKVKDALSAGDFGAINAGLSQATAALEKQRNSVSGYIKLVAQGIDLTSNGGLQLDNTDLGRQLAERNALEQASGDLQLGVQTVGQFNGIGKSGAVTSLEDLQRVIQKVKPAMDGLGISMDDLAQGARDGSIVQMGKDINAWLADPLNRAKMSAEEFKVAIDNVYAALSKRASMRDFEAAIDAATKSLKENGRNLDIGTEKGRNNQAALDNIANTALKVAEGLQGMNRVRVLERARQEFIDTAVKMGMDIDKARDLAAHLIQVGKIKVKPEVSVETSRALAEIARVRAYLDGLHSKSVEVQVTQAVTRRLIEQTGLPKADGGYISGPGGPRDDQIPAWLSNGEFVVNAAATAANRGLLERINAQKFADGGYASRDLDTMRYQSRQGHHSTTNKMTVSLGDLRVVGTLQTPWGPAQVEGIARAAARDEVNDSAALDRTHAGMFRGGIRG